VAISAGSLGVSMPVAGSKRHADRLSPPSELANTKRFDASAWIACAFGWVGISCCTAPTSPSLSIELTVILWPPYEAANSQRPLRSTSMLAMLSASAASPSFFSRPLAVSIAKLITRYGCERSAA
jgi:hypothetical protein